MLLYNVIPNNGPLVGGNMVTLVGSDLGVNDTTAITLNGVPVAQWWWLDGSTIVAKAAPGGMPGIGPVVINSTTYGVVVGPTYRYNNGRAFHCACGCAVLTVLQRPF